jgi:kynurenine formamidase
MVGEHRVEDEYQREQDALAELKTMTNWGRWGDNDERGTLNLVTAEVVRNAVTLVKRGLVFALGEPIGTGSPRFVTLPGPEHFMKSVEVLDEAWGEPVQVAVDGLALPAIHGVCTHIDALCHVGAGGGKLFNGFDQSAVGTSGTDRLGIENAPGIVTRGVLLDIARLKGLDSLPSHYLINAADIEEAARAGGVTIKSGDAVLVRTGWRKFAHNPQEWSWSQPGIGPSAALYLARRDVCLIGADNLAVEVVSRDREAVDPRVSAGFVNRLHPRLMGDLGIYLLELLVLDWLE